MSLKFGGDHNRLQVHSRFMRGCNEVSTREIHTLVVGAGQAGLAMGYYLKKKTDSFILIDAHKRLGDSWRNRYDSLVLFTPRAYSSLPGLALPGEQDGYPTKDELADYLENYARHFDLPVALNTKAEKLEKTDRGFVVETNQGNYLAQNVIIATGPFQKPFTPDFSRQLSDDVFQVHSAYYRNPTQLKEGPVLVVGAGNSGVQIATELAQDREVFLSVGKPMKMFPHKILNKSLFWWFDVLGISKITINSKLGRYMKENDPIIGKESKPFIKKGKIRLCPRTKSVEGNRFFFEDGSHCDVNNVIWATGFHPDYSWIHVKGIFDHNGNPIHKRGETPVSGLYFLGLSWLYTRGSALLLGVGKDAEYLTNIMTFDTKSN